MGQKVEYASKCESTDQIYFVFSRSERVPFSVKTSESFLAMN